MIMPLTRAWKFAWTILLGSSLAQASPPPQPTTRWDLSGDTSSMIVVAIAEKADAIVRAGATPRGYGGLSAYDGSRRSITAATRLAHDYALDEVVAWTIEPLRLRCMVYRIGDKETRAVLLHRLQQDPRVVIAQPLHEFQTQGQPGPAAKPIASAAPASYNDPYHHLQTNFASLDASSAQRWSIGDGIRVALIDTAVDATHPDLAGRVVEQRDLVSNNQSKEPLSAMEQRHGTEIAGLIAAVANNHIGIVGIAPGVQILSYRACWGASAVARCNSFTLALALTAAIQSKARIVNLSLGGPADPLLHQLLSLAIKQGTIVVGAVPPDGRTDGFPIDVDGVIAVSSDDGTSGNERMLHAPGRDLLTLQAGGHYGYASGSSLATAQASAVVALLLQLRPDLDAAITVDLLRRSQRAGGPINACIALAALLHREGNLCATEPALAKKISKTTTH